MKLTRRELLAGAAVGAAGTAGVYELVDRFAGTTPSRAAVGPAPPEQYLLQGVRVVRSDGIEVLVPPLHHEVHTAQVAVDRADLADARSTLESALAGLDRDYAASPAGLGVTVAWGLPYFRRFVPAAAERHLPHDRRANTAALLDSKRFQSDPPQTVLESNDLAILLRSDQRAHIDDAVDRLKATKVLSPTSIRRGFAGGGFDGGQSLPKQLALAAGVPGADLIPDTSELFLGFTSTQRASMGPGRIANFETLGYVDLRGSDYFRHGTHMHLSHIAEDLEAWYLNFDFDERVSTSFRPNLRIPTSRQTVAEGPQDAQSVEEVVRGYRESGRIGHSGSLQPVSRLQARHVAPDGTVYPKGTAIPVRADFNTLDNPFSWSSSGDVSATPSAGLHFVIFNPTSDDFARNRQAMDGGFPNRKRLPLPARGNGQGFNAVLRTTHRQNFLVPPRRHRSFPLSEL
jgi:hypothetical protein